MNALRQMGMPLYGAIPPTGYKWDAADWVSTGALVDRMNFALALAGNRLPGITVEWAPELDMGTPDNDATSKQAIPTPESEEARLEPLLVAGGVSEATRAAALQQFQAQNAQNSAASVTQADAPGAPAQSRARGRRVRARRSTTGRLADGLARVSAGDSEERRVRQA